MIVRSYNPVEGGPAVWVDGPIGGADMVLRFARQFADLPAGDGPIDVVISSGGGDCGVGLELYTLLRECGRRVRTTILRAHSMASVVAMAGDERRIARHGSLFFHGTGFSGIQVADAQAMAGHHTASALRTMARRAEASDATTGAILSRATGLDPAEIRRLREAETTVGADEAVYLGFAHSIVEVAP